VTLQSMIRDNLQSQKYLTEGYSRIWTSHKTLKHDSLLIAVNRNQSAPLLTTTTTTTTMPTKIENGSAQSAATTSQGKSGTGKMFDGASNSATSHRHNGYMGGAEHVSAEDIIKKFELNRDLIVGQSGESTLGATVTLAQLLHSSEGIVQLLVNNDLMVRFKSLGELL
jgi:hypothetical protein